MMREKKKYDVAVPLKLFGLCTLLGSLADDDEEVLCQYKGHSLSLVAKFLLLMIQEMAKIYMKQLEDSRTKIKGQEVKVCHSF